MKSDKRFRRRNHERYYTNSFISAPLCLHGSVRGVINVNNKRNQEVFTSADGGGDAGVVRTDIESTMRGINSTAYARVPFTIANTAELDSLSLEVQYNDGFVAYLNGTEVARRKLAIRL